MDSNKNKKASPTKHTWDDFWVARTKKKSWFVSLLNFVNDRTMVKKSVDLAVRYSQKGTVLQAGSGEGRNSLALAKKRGDKVIALDYSTEALKLAKLKADEYNISIQLLNEDMSNMSFKDKSLELVWNEGVMEHFENPLPYLREMRRVGKRVICIVPTLTMGWRTVKFIKNLMKADEGINEGYYEQHTPESLKKIFLDAGFKDCIVEEIRILLFIKHLAAIGVG